MRTVNRKSESLVSGQEPAGAAEARDTDWTRLQGETRMEAPVLLAPTARDERSASPREKQTNRRSLQEYVHKNRCMFFFYCDHWVKF